MAQKGSPRVSAENRRGNLKRCRDQGTCPLSNGLTGADEGGVGASQAQRLNNACGRRGWRDGRFEECDATAD